jgi:AcrR family transcriptional regulator
MARSRRRTAASASPEAADGDRIIDAMLALLPRQGWRRLSLAAIAAEAGLPILRVYRAFSSKQAILCAFYRRIDEAVLGEPPEREADERPRDRVFDLLMRRFDALHPYKGALEVLFRELPGDPVTAACLAATLFHSLRWLLEAAGIPTTGLRGMISVKLTAAAYVAAVRVWLRDDSSDLARTMATLDARLRRIERWLATEPRHPREAPSPA